jgi:mono/diheme cytochrome c family protein
MLNRKEARMSCVVVGCVLLAGLALPAPAKPADKRDDAAARRGGVTFQTHCAPCHGTSAKGDGPMADALRFVPADLTTIARRSGGSFPEERVAKIIDGREKVAGHGGTDMPIWGDVFRSSGQRYDEKKVKATIGDLVQFLATLQERPAR